MRSHYLFALYWFRDCQAGCTPSTCIHKLYTQTMLPENGSLIPTNLRTIKCSRFHVSPHYPRPIVVVCVSSYLLLLLRLYTVVRALLPHESSFYPTSSHPLYQYVSWFENHNTIFTQLIFFHSIWVRKMRGNTVVLGQIHDHDRTTASCGRWVFRGRPNEFAVMWVR